MFPLKEHDVIVAGSDGVFDNLFEKTIAEMLQELEAYQGQTLCDRLADLIVQKAVEMGWSPVYRSPFAKKACKAGKKFIGGKLDDTTVVVSIVQESG